MRVESILGLFRRPRVAPPTAHLCYEDVCGIEYPAPALQRGWMHVRTQIGLWDVGPVVNRLGRGLWLSALAPDDRRARAALQNPAMEPRAVAGFWPDGGFVELLVRGNAELEDVCRFQLRVFAGTPVLADRMLEQFRAGYLIEGSSAPGEPRIALVNSTYCSLDVQRVPISAGQLVPRASVDLFYGDGMSDWVDAWTGRLAEKRYGLTILSGEPGTGKTTLLRSVAAWLSRTHAFYFMPASRFANIDAGDLVAFWIEEGRVSKLRNVLVLEDAESILLRREGDNRERVALLLNLTDGIMGDALALQIVCTLNSTLADLDPALLRPGRLVAQRVFSALDAATAARLADHLGLPDPRAARVSLAELFHPADLALNSPGAERRAALGFGMRFRG